MSRRKSKSSARPQALWALGIAALLLFAAGEIFLLVRSESGQLMLARQVGLTDPARLTQIVGREIKRGLQAAGVPPDSIDEAVPEAGAPLRWRVGIKPGASVLQANYAVTHSVELHGGVVLDGRETWTDRGDEIVTLTVGLPGRVTHEVLEDNKGGTFNGNHLMAPEVVRGTLLSNADVLDGKHGLEDLTVEILKQYGITPGPGLRGGPVLR